MKTKFINYFQIASNINEPYQDRKKIIALALGYACACSVPMPSGKLDNVDEHFAVNATGTIRRWVGFFNEVMPLDVVGACDAAQRFWIMRYNTIHKCPNLDIVEGDFFASLFGVPNHFDPESIKILNEHNMQIAPIYRAACLIINDWVSTNE